MFSKYDKRDLAMIALLLMVSAMTAWGTLYVLNNYVIGESDDPLVKARQQKK